MSGVACKAKPEEAAPLVEDEQKKKAFSLRADGSEMRRRGREAEGDGLLNRYTGLTCIEGSNPSVSAI